MENFTLKMNGCEDTKMEYECKYPEDQNVLDLPGKIMLHLRDALNCRSSENIVYWRRFAAALNGHLHFTAQEVERLAGNLYNGGSPAQHLISSVGARGMNVRQLVKVLDQLKMEDILCELVKCRNVEIISQPESYVKVREGDQVVISVKAVGMPYPRYLWYFSPNKLDAEEGKPTGDTGATLVLHNIRPSQSGNYCCLVYNDSEQGVFSDWCAVTVLADPRPGSPVCTLPVILRQPQPISVHVNRSFCLDCEAHGHLPLEYKWLRNNEPVYVSQTGYYKVDHAGRDDSGVYQCVVSNDYGKVTSLCVSVKVTTHDWPDFSPAPFLPEITEHPKSCQVQIGGHAIFRCSAYSALPLRYQWFKDCDSIQGATECEYKVYNVKDKASQGTYMCLISNEHGQVLTKGAVLQISEALQYKRDYFATDKLALLIGNYDYRSQNSLKAPQTDIQNLSNIFQRVLGFKVVSLLNLTLVEMESAVEEFCELIDSGVYCVFYFCGHGFEENNECWILPNDVPVDYKTEECLSADRVLSKMQKKRPKICCMILDICRKPAENPSQGGNAPLKEYTPVADGNTIVCYATSCGLAAYEFKPQSKGILVTHLEKLLPQPISIEEVFRQVKEAVGTDKRVEGPKTRQIPEVKSNLIEVGRSFCDPIQTTGHTQACTKRQQAWEYAHVKPPPMEVHMNPKEYGVVVELTFQHEFSNVLNVFVKVVNRGILPSCIAWIRTLPNSVSMIKPTCVSAKGDDYAVTKNVIVDIQKLKENLRVSLGMQYRLPESSPADYLITSKENTFVDLQLPLVANLKLWQSRPQPPIRRHAVEQTEEPQG